MGLIASAYVAARIARRRAEEERPTRFSSANDDEAGGFPTRSARSERSEWSNQTPIARRRAGQAGAPLSWTSEGADTLFVCERVRKAAANKRQPQRAQRARYTKRADTLFVGERRRSWRLPRAIRAERAQRAEQSNSAVDLDGDVHARHQWQALQVVDHDLDRDYLGHLLEVSRGVGLRK